jgi:hypothetical protein
MNDVTITTATVAEHSSMAPRATNFGPCATDFFVFCSWPYVFWQIIRLQMRHAATTSHI